MQRKSCLIVNFACGLLNSVLNLPDGQAKFFGGEFKLQKNCDLLIIHHIKNYFWVSQNDCGLAHASYMYSLRQGQAAKLLSLHPELFVCWRYSELIMWKWDSRKKDSRF